MNSSEFGSRAHRLLPDPQAVQETCHQVMTDHRGKMTEAAALLGLSYDGLYSRLIREGTFGRDTWQAINTVRACHAVTGDQRLARILAWEGWRLTPDPGCADADADVLSEIADLTDAASRWRRVTKQALADGEISDDELESIDQALKSLDKEYSEALAAVERLRQSVK